MSAGPRLLVTGFGPFPGAAANPTEALVRGLAKEPPEKFGASALRARVLPTDYRRSWAALRRLNAGYAPDVVVHFGLNSGAEVIHLECLGRNAADPAKLDTGGYSPSSAVLIRRGPERLASTFPAEAVATALKKAGFAAALSDDAGGYVCNATLYRSLNAAPPTRRVGFVHVPPAGTNGLTPDRLRIAAAIILRTAVEAWQRSAVT